MELIDTTAATGPVIKATPQTAQSAGVSVMWPQAGGHLCARIVDPDNAKVWVVRVVLQGQAFGLLDCLAHTHPDPLVEFFDPEVPDSPSMQPGWFVSRYYASTLAQVRGGLCLDTPPYRGVSDAFMAKLQLWLFGELPAH